MEPAQKDYVLKRGASGAKASTYVTVFLCAVKAGVGFFSGSVALLADALHSLADVFTSLAVLLGLRLSQRSPSERFPYGFYRAETLAFLAVSVIVAVSGAEIILQSVRRVRSPFMIGFREATLGVAALSALVSLVLSRYRSMVGKETNSQALQGEARHSMVDVGSSVLVFVGVLGNQLGFAWAESIAGIVIGLLVIGLGLVMGKDAVLVLLDACLKPEVVSRMRTTAMEVSGVKGVHDVKVRRSGPFIFAEMHVEVDPAMRVDRAHEISDAIEEKIKRSIGNLDSITLHTEPSEKRVFRVALPVIEDGGFDSRICDHFGGSPCFIFVDMQDDSPQQWVVTKNPAASVDKRRGIEAAHFLIQHKVDFLLARELGEGPYHVLRSGSVQIFSLDRESQVEDALNAFSRKQLKLLVPVQRTPPAISDAT